MMFPPYNTFQIRSLLFLIISDCNVVWKNNTKKSRLQEEAIVLLTEEISFWCIECFCWKWERLQRSRPNIVI